MGQLGSAGVGSADLRQAWLSSGGLGSVGTDTAGTDSTVIGWAWLGPVSLDKAALGRFGSVWARL